MGYNCADVRVPNELEVDFCQINDFITNMSPESFGYLFTLSCVLSGGKFIFLLILKFKVSIVHASLELKTLLP